jgi:hypothetical protein
MAVAPLVIRWGLEYIERQAASVRPLYRVRPKGRDIAPCELV